MIVVHGVYQEWLPKRAREGSGYRNRLNLEAVIVSAYVPNHRIAHTDVISCAWRHAANPDRWTFAQGFHSSRNLRPHPEADRVWAEYCAAVLLSEGERE